MGQRLHISESEKKDIQKMYNVLKKQKTDYVFDFVLSENNKYLIIMDELFVAGGNGKSVGSIWENTYVFTEILKESVANNVITESIDDFISGVQWTKEQISEWVKETEVLTEGIKDFAKKMFQKGVIPFLRWVRRALYTGVGIVVDVIMSILFVKSNVVVWMLIVILDIGEIISGNFDPKDPIRAQMPYFLLIADLMGCAFTSVVALTTRKAAQKVATMGLHKGAPALVKMFEGLSKKLPNLASKIKEIGMWLGKKMGPKAAAAINKMLAGVDKVFSGLQRTLENMLRPQGKAALGAVQAGGTTLGVVKGMEAAMPVVDPSGKLAQGMVGADRYIGQVLGKPMNSPLPQNERDLIDYYSNL